MLKCLRSVPNIATYVVLFAVVGLAHPRALQANDPNSAIGTPSGPVVLTVSGKIEHTNNGQYADFDMASLMAMAATRITTSTPWTEGQITFEGVSVETLIKRVGAQGRSGEFTALNDYTVRIDLADPIEHGAIIAYLLNGKRMSVREKGPLWLIYPLDSNPKLLSPVYRDRMIWQLRSIEVK